MRDIERFLDQSCRSVSGPPALRRHLREELKEHVLELIQNHVSSGLSEEEAVGKALEEFGKPEEVRDGLEEVYGRRVTALLIEKAMDWKEKTMKAEWKWSFAGQSVLVLVGAVLLIYMGSVLVFVLPRAVELYASRAGEIPRYLRPVTRLAASWQYYWYLWMLPFVLGYALFEWKCRCESKPQIRMTIENVALLVLGIVVCTVSFAVMVALATAPISG